LIFPQCNCCWRCVAMSLAFVELLEWRRLGGQVVSGSPIQQSPVAAPTHPPLFTVSNNDTVTHTLALRSHERQGSGTVITICQGSGDKTSLSTGQIPLKTYYIYCSPKLVFLLKKLYNFVCVLHLSMGLRRKVNQFDFRIIYTFMRDFKELLTKY